MNNHRFHPKRLEQDNVFSKTLFEVFLYHCRTTVLDDDDPVTKTFDVGKGLDQQVLFDQRGYHFRIRW